MKAHFMPLLRNSIVVSIFLLLTACASTSSEKHDPTRDELDEMGEKAIATFVAAKPQVQGLLDNSVGYTVVNMSITKIPGIGTGAGYGVVVDKQAGTRSYLRVTQFEVGGGLGAEKYKVLIIFDDAKLLKKTATGVWHYDAGAQAVAGGESADTSTSKKGEGYEAFKLTESGACVRVTVLVARAKPYLAGQRE